MKKTLSTLFILCFVSAGLLYAADKRPFEVKDIQIWKWPGSPQVSPDGKWVAFAMSVRDLETYKSNGDIWLVPAKGGDVRRLTTNEKSDNHPRWTPGGKSITFLSSRSGSNQIWKIDMAGGEAYQLSDLKHDVEDFEWSPAGNYIVYIAEVCGGNKGVCEMGEKKKEKKTKAMIHDELLYRHWVAYEDHKIKHIFTLTPDGKESNDITPDLELDALQWWMAAAGRDWDISPDGKTVTFATNLNGHLELDYDVDVYTVPIEGGEVTNITDDNKAADSAPRFSPDGKSIAYRASKRPGYESDEYELMVMSASGGSPRSLTDAFIHSVGDIYWSADGKTLYFTAGEKGQYKLFSMPAKGGTVKEVLGGNRNNFGFHVAKKSIAYTRRDITHPNEIFISNLKGGRVKQLTNFNDANLAEIALNDAEEFWFTGSGAAGSAGAQVQGWLVKPADFDPSKKYPMMVRIHGGPQQMFGWSWRYEYQIFTSAGYVVCFINPAGSPGYGQEFTDAVNFDWGGRPYDDLMAGIDHVVSLGFVDNDRIAAWGGSYGGYMVNWMAGHTDRFAALVSHAGLANLWSMYGSTEELFFPEWEMGGTPYERQEEYDKWSPIRYAKNFKTPMLISHGDIDWRVPVTESEQMFTALQRLGVPSKFIRFPDQGHWILKPHDRELWYSTILEWINTYCKPAEEMTEH